MKRLLIGAVAALSIALGVATPAGGAPYTDTDLTFISNVNSLGYYGDNDRLIKTGHVVFAGIQGERVGVGVRRRR